MSRSGRLLSNWLREVLGALLPPACPACDGPAGDEAFAWICLQCRLRLAPLPSPLCARCAAPLGTGGLVTENSSCTECQRWPEELGVVRSATALDGPARVMVHRLKYHGWEGLATAMAPSIHRTMNGCHFDWLVPIPTTPWRRRMRGYNQAERIATAVGKATGIPVLEALVRPRARGTQVALQPHERLANVKRAFLLREESRPRVKTTRICLVDDVLTTGATVCAAAVILRDSGALSVSAITFARAPALRRVAG